MLLRKLWTIFNPWLKLYCISNSESLKISDPMGVMICLSL